MDRSDIVSAVERALREVLNDAVPATLAEDSRLFEDLHLDSTGVLELLMALEENLGIEVDPENLNMDDFQTVGSLTDYLAVTLAAAV
jgi:acyl carrier protein